MTELFIDDNILSEEEQENDLIDDSEIFNITLLQQKYTICYIL